MKVSVLNLQKPCTVSLMPISQGMPTSASTQLTRWSLEPVAACVKNTTSQSLMRDLQSHVALTQRDSGNSNNTEALACSCPKKSTSNNSTAMMLCTDGMLTGWKVQFKAKENTPEFLMNWIIGNKGSPHYHLFHNFWHVSSEVHSYKAVVKSFQSAIILKCFKATVLQQYC